MIDTLLSNLMDNLEEWIVLKKERKSSKRLKAEVQKQQDAILEYQKHAAANIAEAAKLTEEVKFIEERNHHLEELIDFSKTRSDFLLNKLKNLNSNK